MFQRPFRSKYDLPLVPLQRQNNILPVKTRIALVPLQRHVVLNTGKCVEINLLGQCFKITSFQSKLNLPNSSQNPKIE